MAASMRATRFCVHYRKFSRSAVLDNDFTPKQRKPNLTVNHKLKFDPVVEELIVSGEVNFRRHPGIVNVKQVEVPVRLQKAILALAEQYPTPDLQLNADKFANYVWGRNKPMEEQDLRQRVQDIERKVVEREKVNLESMTTAELEEIKPRLQQRAARLWKMSSQSWQPIKYDAYKSFLYLIGRMANDYSTLYRIFSEIRQRDPKFKPWAVFDMGSGVGSSIWAANAIWPDDIKEHYCVDVSEDMNTIARLLLQGGNENKQMCYPGVYFRQYFPPSAKNKYDLVVCSYLLSELPSREERLKVILSLWRKTHKYLVLVNNGTNPAFSLISEARDLLLQLKEHSFGGKRHAVKEDLTGHVFAPCPHDNPCPRLLRRDGHPCFFEVNYQPLKVKGKRKSDKAVSRFSYVVLEKGPRTEIAWPRLVKPVSSASRCVHCRTCTPNGDLENTVLTAAKHGREFFRCARKSNLGDLLPASSTVWEEGPVVTYQSLGKSLREKDTTTDEKLSPDNDTLEDARDVKTSQLDCDIHKVESVIVKSKNVDIVSGDNVKETEPTNFYVDKEAEPTDFYVDKVQTEKNSELSQEEHTNHDADDTVSQNDEMDLCRR